MRISQRAVAAFVNTAGKALLWATSALTADRTWTIPDYDMDFGKLGMTLVSETTAASAVSAIDLTGVFTEDPGSYLLELFDFRPAIDNAQLVLRLSTDGGSTWLTSGIAYSYLSSATAANALSDQKLNQNNIVVSTPATSLASVFGISGDIHLRKRAANTRAFITSSNIDTPQSAFNTLIVNGFCSAAPVNALRLTMTAGNISAGALVRVWKKKRTS